LPNLKSIGGEIMVYLTNALVETDFRSLESVGYRVYYERNIVLRRFGLDSLAQTGSLVFSACFEAARCELEAICSQVAPTTCAISTGLTTCACETSCGRLAPVCPTM
jgi:hypothetical protein